jgi:hypothetical protein
MSSPCITELRSFGTIPAKIITMPGECRLHKRQSPATGSVRNNDGNQDSNTRLMPHVLVGVNVSRNNMN